MVRHTHTHIHTHTVTPPTRLPPPTHTHTRQLRCAHAHRGLISTALSLAKKLKIIEAVEKGDKSHRDVAKEFSVAKSTVRLLCCKIRKQLSLL